MDSNSTSPDPNPMPWHYALRHSLWAMPLHPPFLLQIAPPPLSLTETKLSPEAPCRWQLFFSIPHIPSPWRWHVMVGSRSFPSLKTFYKFKELTLSHLNYFPIAIITDSHKISNFKQYKYITSPLWTLEVQNGFHWAKIKELAELHPSVSLPLPAPRHYASFIPWWWLLPTHASSTASSVSWTLLPSARLLLRLEHPCLLLTGTSWWNLAPR